MRVYVPCYTVQVVLKLETLLRPEYRLQESTTTPNSFCPTQLSLQ